MQPRIICSLELHNWWKWLDCNMGKLSWSQELNVMTIPYRYKVE